MTPKTIGQNIDHSKLQINIPFISADVSMLDISIDNKIDILSQALNIYSVQDCQICSILSAKVPKIIKIESFQTNSKSALKLQCIQI